MQRKLKAGSREKNWDVGIFYSVKSEAFSFGTIFLLINFDPNVKKGNYCTFEETSSNFTVFSDLK